VKYFELTIELGETEPWRDILIAELAEHGFESFVETKTGFQGYIPETLFKPGMIEPLLDGKPVLSRQLVEIAEQNWNAEWEKNFDPVFVEDKLAIVAPFHEVKGSFKQVITITPKMSFGTGHHQTTWMMSRQLFDLDLAGKHVLDMGTGTGVLAILAEKLGAAYIFAPDIDQWSYENAVENCRQNKCGHVEAVHGGHELLAGKFFHIILANINKNVLVQHFSVYSTSLNSGGLLLISGFFETDRDDLVREAAKHGFIFDQLITKEGWALIQFIKKTD
jgi:ribosomal protein L11 methyltransferase